MEIILLTVQNLTVQIQKWKNPLENTTKPILMKKERKKCPLFNGIFWQLLVCVKRISVKNPALRNYLSGIPIIYSPWVGGSNYQWGVGKIFIPCSRVEGGLKLISNFVPHHVIFVPRRIIYFCNASKILCKFFRQV